MDNNDILELLDILYGMITEAWSVPLGNDKCIIEREKAIEIINEIKANLPTSLAESKRLVSARDEFIGNAKREAEALRKSAEERAKTLVEEQEVIRIARARSADMISSAEAKSNELRRLASEYVDDLMKKAEQSLTESLKSLQSAQAAFSTSSSAPAAKQQPRPAAAQPQARPNVNQQQRTPQNAPQPTKQGANPGDKPKVQIQSIPRETQQEITKE